MGTQLVRFAYVRFRCNWCKTAGFDGPSSPASDPEQAVIDAAIREAEKEGWKIGDLMRGVRCPVHREEED